MNNPLNSTDIKRMNTKFLVVFSFILVFISGLPLTAWAQEASFYVSPSKGSYEVGGTFSTNILINAEGISINAAQATVYFPPEKLKVLKVSKQNSIFSLWVQEPIFSNSQGTVSFTGGLPSPGFIGKSGRVISILFQAKSIGEAKVYFRGEKILANDPKGTDIFSFSQGGSYSIVAPGEMPPLKEIPPELLIIDSQPPYPFEITIDNEGDPTNPSPFLYFETTDDDSGISYYEVKIGEDVFEVKPGETLPWQIPKLAPADHSVFIKVFDKAGNFIESSTDFTIESIPVPQITVCPKTFKSGEEIIYVGGTALPNSKVIVSFEKDGELMKRWETLSDEKGDWSLAKDGLFRSGIYKISAKTEDSRRAISNDSEACFVKVILGGMAIGPWIIEYKDLSWIAMILLIILIVAVFYLLWRTRRARKRIKIETEDLKKKFYKEYNELRADIEQQIEIFKKAKNHRPLTPPEKERERKLLKNLADVERVLREELKDIEEIK